MEVPAEVPLPSTPPPSVQLLSGYVGGGVTAPTTPITVAESEWAEAEEDGMDDDGMADKAEEDGMDDDGMADEADATETEESEEATPMVADPESLEQARVSLDEQLRASQARFRDRLLDIMDRYSQPFDGDDEIDLETLEIVQDRGFVRAVDLDRFNDASILFARAPRPAHDTDSGDESDGDPDYDDYVDAADAALHLEPIPDEPPSPPRPAARATEASPLTKAPADPCSHPEGCSKPFCFRCSLR